MATTIGARAAALVAMDEHIAAKSTRPQCH
jgi:hypothetical protein